MTGLLYGLNSLLIAGALLALLLVAIGLGHRAGRGGGASSQQTMKDHVNSIQSSLLAVLGLLLAFSFSLALQRFDNRNAAVVDEANAIGTAFLRARLLPGPADEDARGLLSKYIDLRVRTGAVPFDGPDERKALLAETCRVQAALWDVTCKASVSTPNSIPAGLFVASVNEMIDSFGRREAAQRRHVPEIILWILFVTVAMTGWVVGFAAGLAGHRPAVVFYALALLIVALTILIIDLDRPRRGLIRVDQANLLDLKTSIESPLPAAGP